MFNVNQDNFIIHVMIVCMICKSYWYILSTFTCRIQKLCAHKKDNKIRCKTHWWCQLWRVCYHVSVLMPLTKSKRGLITHTRWIKQNSVVMYVTWNVLNTHILYVNDLHFLWPLETHESFSYVRVEATNHLLSPHLLILISKFTQGNLPLTRTLVCHILHMPRECSSFQVRSK